MVGISVEFLCRAGAREGLDAVEATVLKMQKGGHCPLEGNVVTVTIPQVNVLSAQRCAVEKYGDACPICRLKPRPEDFRIEW